MTHEEQRIWLIRQLLNEDPRYRNYQIPEEEREQKDLLRALMNVRLPNPMSEEILEVQDEYLTEENRQANITDISDLTPCAIDDRIYLWQGDITTFAVDAIDSSVFAGDTEIVKMVLPDMEVIEEGLFDGCTALRGVSWH